MNLTITMRAHLQNALLSSVLMGLVTIVLSSVYIQRSWAETISPESVTDAQEIRRDLEDILAQPEFQPRGNSVSAWDRLKQNVKHWVGERISELWDSIPKDLIKVDSTSAFGRFLMRLADIATAIVDFLIPVLARWREILLCTGIILLLYFGLPFLAQRLRRERATEVVMQTPPKRRERTIAEVQELGLTRPGLAAFRELLRSELEKKYAVAFSTTDRELCQKLPSDENKVEIFTKTAGLFENVEFAGSPLAPEPFSDLLTLYKNSNKSEQT